MAMVSLKHQATLGIWTSARPGLSPGQTMVSLVGEYSVP
jgi:hypothetical protein